ncbi:AMP-binding protein [Alcaligenaceae bacterium]|nr:AMP-binding protein [Alcaligenaceae bacterium]
MRPPEQRKLWDLVESRAQATPAGVAFIEDGREISCTEFFLLCSKTANWLGQQGLVSGDLVAVWLVNRVEWLAILFATARLGITLVPINTRYRSDEVTHILGKCGAKMLIFQPGFRKINFSDILASMDANALPQLEKIAVVDGAANTPSSLLGCDTVHFNPLSCDVLQAEDNTDPAARSILFTTSGTTKGPKLVMHAQQTLVEHAQNCVPAYGLDQKDAVLLAMMPFCGVFGLNVALAGFTAGVPMILIDTFDAELCADLIQRHQVTHTFGSDEVIRRLGDLVPGDLPFPSLRLFGFGAFTSSFTEYAINSWKRGIPLFGMYGSSEVLAIFAVQGAELSIEERIEGGGRPVAGNKTQVRIRDIETGELLPVGETGEIEILGPSNFMGYFNDPQATLAAVCADGFFRTGDIGYLRADGSFVYKTRKGDAIRLGGFLVNPVEIEEVMKRLDGVADAQVTAIDIEGKLRAVAFVIPAPGWDLDAGGLIRQMAATVATFKVPAYIWFVDAYPVTQSSNGLKVQRNKLRDMANEKLAAS